MTPRKAHGGEKEFLEVPRDSSQKPDDFGENCARFLFVLSVR